MGMLALQKHYRSKDVDQAMRAQFKCGIAKELLYHVRHISIPFGLMYMHCGRNLAEDVCRVCTERFLLFVYLC